MYGGELIHQSSDEYGSIEVVDFQPALRSLHFGNKTQQSAMLLSSPFILVHKYAQAMMLPLSWKTPQRALVLGLGSGSIVKYLYNYCQNLRVDAVELRGEVIELAKRYFLLPEADERLHIYNESAFDWINTRSNELSRKESQVGYDLILVDMFLTTDTGTDITVSVPSHINALTHLLNPEGILILNQLGDSILSYPGLDTLRANFPQQLYSINIESVNSILLASKAALPEAIDKTGFCDIELSYMLPFRHYFNSLTPVSAS
ncbi:hypothetical protein MNBD_GAMMA11-1141 [hydrothermal vent metagenome]|uniref:PABS domain-containing protein n=1 Tax=hydrothermal vent metagenome TaxID=652676 RepID=A0A3B0X5B1_9ZZZZ